jgi:pimeloyl-ACP methyl ester carboxylesterase
MIPVRHLSLGNNRLTYRVIGSGPDVLLIHGWISSGRMWEALMCEMAQTCRVWALDLLGFGDSQGINPAKIITLNDEARLLVAFCKEMGIRSVTAVGHSMGGTLAVKLALEQPDLINKIVLICPVITGKLVYHMEQFLANPVGQTLLNFSQRFWPNVFTMPQVTAVLAPPYIGEEACRRTIEDLRKATWGAAYGCLMSMLNINLDKYLHKVKKPTLVITGAQDVTIPPTESKLAADLIPGAHYIELPHCHHQPPDEDPIFLMRTIGAFLTDTLETASDDAVKPAHAA